MNTKVAYVVVSGKHDVYYEQAWVSAFSLKQHNPQIEIVYVVDQDTYSCIFSTNRKNSLEVIDKIIKVEVPDNLQNKERSRWLKTSLRQHIDGDYLFIDTDTVICDSLEEIENEMRSQNVEIAAVPDRHILISDNLYGAYTKYYAVQCGWNITPADKIYFNSGVMYVKDTTFTRDFYTKWHEHWLSCAAKGLYFDQIPLAITNQSFGFPIKELRGEWNCQILTNALRFLYDAKIIHYMASNNVTEKAYWFANHEPFEKLRNTGVMSEELLQHITNAKSAFSRINMVVTGSEYELQTGPIHFLMVYHPSVYKKILSASAFILRFLRFWDRKISSFTRKLR